MYFLDPRLTVLLSPRRQDAKGGIAMPIKELLVVMIVSSTVGISGYLLVVQKFEMSAGLYLVAAAIAAVLILKSDAISSIEASVGQTTSIRAEMKNLREDVFAKVEYVKRLGEELARLNAHNVAIRNRFTSDDHQKQMIEERERIRSMMVALGSEPSMIKETLDEIDKWVEWDLRNEVVSAVGMIHGMGSVAFKKIEEDLRRKVHDYDQSSRKSLEAFLKEHSEYSDSVGTALDRLDVFLKEKHL